MDWATFVTDNSQALFTLGGVLLGSIITFIGNYLNNRFQAKENDKERAEKRREANTQLAVELMRNDIKKIEDVNTIAFEISNTIKLLNLRRDNGELSAEEWQSELDAMMTSQTGVVGRLIQMDTTTDVLVYAIGDDVYSNYIDFKEVLGDYLDILRDASVDDAKTEKAYEKLVESNGKFQKSLRRKLLETRGN